MYYNPSSPLSKSTTTYKESLSGRHMIHRAAVIALDIANLPPSSNFQGLPTQFFPHTVQIAESSLCSRNGFFE